MSKIGSMPLPAAHALRKLGRDLALARRKRGIPTSDMAARLFVSRDTLWRLERGDRGLATTQHVQLGTLDVDLYEARSEASIRYRAIDGEARPRLIPCGARETRVALAAQRPAGEDAPAVTQRLGDELEARPGKAGSDVAQHRAQDRHCAWIRLERDDAVAGTGTRTLRTQLTCPTSSS